MFFLPNSGEKPLKTLAVLRSSCKKYFVIVLKWGKLFSATGLYQIWNDHQYDFAEVTARLR
jgi:hypothetical protein